MKTQIVALVFFFAAMPAVAAPGPATSAADASAAERVPVVKLTMPLTVTAHDLITKVYGFIDSGCTRDQTVEAVRRVASIVPEEDDFGLWLNVDNGYSVSYYGLMPEAEAMVQYDGGRVSGYGYFFFFPYGRGNRDKANLRQSEFCGVLLQELLDMGLSIGVPGVTDSMFEVIGDYYGNYVDIRLLEEICGPDGVVYSDRLSALIDSESEEGSPGRFVVMLNVEPGGFTAADDLVAEEM